MGTMICRFMILKMRWKSIGVSNHRLFSESVFKEADAIQVCVPLEMNVIIEFKNSQNRDKE